MLSVLLLLVLSSASLQDNVDNQPLGGKGSSVDLVPENEVAKIPVNVSISTVRRVLSPSKFRQKRELASLSSMLVGTMHWVTWENTLPDGSVSINNTYDKRIDYICKVECISGFYNSDKGPYCHYPQNTKEHRSTSFQILVNKDNFEILEWKEDSKGSVPKHSVKTCSSKDIYVGKNIYGLGMVYPKNSSFYLPWEGNEYVYNNYEVLTLVNAESNLVYDVKYYQDASNIFKEPPITIQTSVAVNDACSPVSKTVSLTKRTSEERRWDTSSTFRPSKRTTLRVRVPLIIEGNFEVSPEQSFRELRELTFTGEITYTVSLTIIVPPNHSCKINLVAFMYKLHIPFTARLSHTYDRETRSTTISGMYHSVQTGQLSAKIDRCVPLPNSKQWCK